MSRFSLAIRVTGLFGIRIGGALLLILQVAAVAYLFGLDVVGINGIFWSAVVISRVAGPLGLDILGLKDTANQDGEASESMIASVALRDTRALAYIWGTVVAITLVVWGLASLAWQPTGALGPVLAVSCAASAFQRLWFVSLLARGRSIFGQLLESIAIPVAAIAAAWLTPPSNPEAFLLGQGAAVVLITLIFGASALWPVLKRRVAVEPVRWKTALTIALGATLTALAVRSPIFLVGMTSNRAAGEYDIAQRFQSAGSVSVSAVSTAVMPRLSVSLQKYRRWETLKLLVASALMSCFLPFTIALVLVVVGPGWVGEVMGPEYGALWLPSLLLTVSSFVNALTSSVGNALSLGGHERFFAWISAFQLCAIISVALVAGPVDAFEMATIVLAAECLRSLLLVLIYWRTRPRGRRRAR